MTVSSNCMCPVGVVSEHGLVQRQHCPQQLTGAVHQVVIDLRKHPMASENMFRGHAGSLDLADLHMKSMAVLQGDFQQDMF